MRKLDMVTLSRLMKLKLGKYFVLICLSVAVIYFLDISVSLKQKLKRIPTN